MIYFNAFLVCGTICAIGQLIYDHTNFTMGHITSTFVVVGAFLDIMGIYDQLIVFGGAGASLPITSFGHSLIHAALASAKEHGIIGILLGIFDLSSAGITSAIFFATVIAFCFRPKS